MNNQSQTQAGQSARKALITDLENAGLSAQQAARYVQNLANQISALHRAREWMPGLPVTDKKTCHQPRWWTRAGGCCAAG